MRHIARHSEDITGFEVFHRLVTDIHVALTDSHIANLLCRMRVERIRFSHRAVVEIYDHGHQIVQVDKFTGNRFTYFDRICLVVFQEQIQILQIDWFRSVIYLQGQFSTVHCTRSCTCAAITAYTIFAAGGSAGLLRIATARDAVSSHQSKKSQEQIAAFLFLASSSKQDKGSSTTSSTTTSERNGALPLKCSKTSKALAQSSTLQQSANASQQEQKQEANFSKTSTKAAKSWMASVLILRIFLQQQSAPSKERSASSFTSSSKPLKNMAPK